MAGEQGSTRVAVAAGIGALLVAAVLALLISSDGDAESTADDPPPTSQATPEANTPTPEPTTAPEPTATTAPEPVAPAPDPPPTPEPEPTLRPDRDPTPTSEPTPDATPTPAPTLTIAATTPTPSVTPTPTPTIAPSVTPTPTLEPVPLPAVVSAVVPEQPKPEPPKPEPPKPEPPKPDPTGDPRNLNIAVEPRPSAAYLDFLGANGLFNPVDERPSWCYPAGRADFGMQDQGVSIMLGGPQSGADLIYLCALVVSGELDGSVIELLTPSPDLQKVSSITLLLDPEPQTTTSGPEGTTPIIGEFDGPGGTSLRRYVGLAAQHPIDEPSDGLLIQVTLAIDEHRPAGDWVVRFFGPNGDRETTGHLRNYCTDTPPTEYVGPDPALALHDIAGDEFLRPPTPGDGPHFITGIQNCRFMPDVIGQPLSQVTQIVADHARNAGYTLTPGGGTGNCGRLIDGIYNNEPDLVDYIGVGTTWAPYTFLDEEVVATVYRTIRCPTLSMLPKLATPFVDVIVALEKLEEEFPGWQVDRPLSGDCTETANSLVRGYESRDATHVDDHRPLPVYDVLADSSSDHEVVGPVVIVRC